MLLSAVCCICAPGQVLGVRNSDYSLVKMDSKQWGPTLAAAGADPMQIAAAAEGTAGDVAALLAVQVCGADGVSRLALHQAD